MGKASRPIMPATLLDSDTLESWRKLSTREVCLTRRCPSRDSSPQSGTSPHLMTADPSEVDAFIKMIRELRRQGGGTHRPQMNVLLLDTNVVSILFNRKHSLRTLGLQHLPVNGTVR